MKKEEFLKRQKTAVRVHTSPWAQAPWPFIALLTCPSWARRSQGVSQQGSAFNGQFFPDEISHPWQQGKPEVDCLIHRMTTSTQISVKCTKF